MSERVNDLMTRRNQIISSWYLMLTCVKMMRDTIVVWTARGRKLWMKISHFRIFTNVCSNCATSFVQFQSKSIAHKIDTAAKLIQMSSLLLWIWTGKTELNSFSLGRHKSRTAIICESTTNKISFDIASIWWRGRKFAILLYFDFFLPSSFE